jgi:hypothetical protein
MPLRDFQRALSDMALDTRVAAAIRKNGTTALTRYALTALEQERLVHVARQPGMDLTCTLARLNRFGPIVEFFPLVCELLKPGLRELLEEFWSSHRPDNYQLAGEENAFAVFLQAKIDCRELTHPYAEEVVKYENACLELAKSLRYVAMTPPAPVGSEPFRLTRFRHDPRILLRDLKEFRTPPNDLPEGDYPVRITLRGDALDVELDG